MDEPQQVLLVNLIAADLTQHLRGWAVGGSVTPEGVNPQTGRTLRTVLEDLQATIDEFLAAGGPPTPLEQGS